METRCKSLEQNICDMLEANLQCQTEEVRLRETTVNMVDETEYSKIADKLKTVQNSLVSHCLLRPVKKSDVLYYIIPIDYLFYCLINSRKLLLQ